MRRALTVRRAFDIGSGSIKCQVAEVDPLASQIHRVLYARSMPVLFRGASGTMIPSTAQAEGLASIQTMLIETDAMGVEASAGIATEVFRNADNASTVIDDFASQTGVPISIVRPAREGELSYLSARGLRTAQVEAPEGRNARELVAWDCGAGSFQFTSSGSSHYDCHGSGTIHAASLELLRAGFERQALLDALLNSLHSQLLPKPDWLAALDAHIVAVGSAQSIFNQQRVLSGAGCFTVSDVEATIREVVALEPEEVLAMEQERGAPLGVTSSSANTPYVLPKLALLLGVMRKFELGSVEFHQTHGNCAGLLVDPLAWGTENAADATCTTPVAGSTPAVIGGRDTEEALQSEVSRQDLLLTANWHLEKTCNYKCKFCYAHFADDETVNLDETTGIQLLDTMKDWGVFKVNFAGGEPLLNKHLGTYLKHAKEIGLKTSIITNATKLTWSWLQMYAPYIDQVGISCDSLDDAVNKRLGRGSGTHVAITERAFRRLREVNETLSLDIKLKLNTVVTRESHGEDWADFIARNGVERWKVFKVLRIEGENDETFGELEVTDAEFDAFRARHAAVEQMVSEDNDEMTSSYIMITPDGRFYQNTEGRYTKSQPILDVGMQAGLEQVGFDYEKFHRRGGAYEL
jgi:radical S-adenosyl methionine domain-containing protein 2